MMFESLFGKKGYANISQSEARKRLASGRKVVLLDVRTPEEYREVHIPAGKLLPLDRLESDAARVVGDKNTEIIVYCRSGARAAAACRQLAAMGYTDVSNMGGVQSWKYETERGRS